MRDFSIALGLRIETSLRKFGCVVVDGYLRRSVIAIKSTYPMSRSKLSSFKSLRLSRMAVAVLMANGALHVQASTDAAARHADAATEYSEHESAVIGTPPPPAPVKKLLKSSAMKTFGFIDDQPVVNSLAGTLQGEVKFAQTHTIDPAGNRAKEMPALITERDALLMFIPTDKNAERKSLKVTATLDGKELGTLEMVPPADFPKSDQNNFSSGYQVEYSQHAWSVNLPWTWMKKGLALHFADGNGQRGDLAADKIEFSGAAQYVQQFIRIGLLTDPNPPTFAENHPEQAAIDYFQKVPASELTFAYYLPVKFDKIETTDGTIYTNHLSGDGDWHSGDKQAFRNFVIPMVAQGINRANAGILGYEAGNSWTPTGYAQTVSMSPVSMFANGRKVQGGLSWSYYNVGSVQIENTDGNEATHEWGHNLSLYDYEGGGFGSHNMNSGWGYDAFYQRMIGPFYWGAAPASNELSGVITHPYKNIFRFNRDAMSGGSPGGAFARYTLYTGYSAKRIQSKLNSYAIIDPTSSTGYRMWNAARQHYDEYSTADLKKPAKSGVPVVTLIGQYDPQLEKPGMLYKPMFGSWGNIFDFAKPNENTPDGCWLDVRYPDHHLKVALHGKRYKAGVSNQISINLPMEPFPQQAEVVCKLNGAQTVVASEAIAHPSQLPHAAVVVGQDAGYGAAVQALKTELDRSQGQQVPELSQFASHAAERMSESDRQQLSTAELDTLTRYERFRQGVAAIDNWVAAFVKSGGDKRQVTAQETHELDALMQQYGLQQPSNGSTIKIQGKCLATDPDRPGALKFTGDCDTPAAKSWVMDSKGRIASLARIGTCIAGRNDGETGAPLESCDNAQSWGFVNWGGHTFVRRDAKVFERNAATDRLTINSSWIDSSSQYVDGPAKNVDPLLEALSYPTWTIVDRVLHPGAVAVAGPERTVVATGNVAYAYELNGANSKGKSLKYRWRLANGAQGFSVRNADQANAEAIVSKDTTGEGVYELTVTDESGKTASARTKVIAVAPQVTLSKGAAAGSYSASANFGSVDYTWTLADASGKHVATGQGANWQAPADLAVGVYKLTVQGYSSSGERRATAEQNVIVEGAPPVAVAGPARTVVATSNFSYAYGLNGSESSEPSGKTLKYHWRLANDAKGFGVRNADQANAEAIVSKDTTGEGVYELTVTNESGKSASARTKVIAVAPQVTLSKGAAAGSYSASANFGSVDYTWTLADASGKHVATGQGASWQAPADLAAGVYKVAVQAYSSSGERRATAEQRLTVEKKAEPAPAPVTARITGPDEATSGEKITLDASNSSVPSNPDDVVYHWIISPASLRDESGSNFAGRRVVIQAPDAGLGSTVTAKLSVYTRDRQTDTTTKTIAVKPGAGDASKSTESADASPSPAYRPGLAYQGGDVVTNRGQRYECKPFPYSSWCGQAPSAYEPGVGYAWTDAWKALPTRTSK
ncbi:M66 family metalloprotease [Burkholderia ubonensis]|uniref:M66 family metalloprotease n=1 Tax=Burkholderia ubonensis TaxID=101571 RepID=UPI0012F91218|nr:M66 family metalloprotease [Burkholderia ubonensis]